MFIKDKDILYQFLGAYCTVGNEEDCWIYEGPVDKNLGYGRIVFSRKPMTAHKAVFIMAYGNYPKFIKGRKTCIRHLCNNKLCINPNHLALGTYTDNRLDASALGTGTKVTLDMLETALELRNKGFTYKEIGKRVGLSEAVVSNSLNGRTHYCRDMLKQLGVWKGGETSECK